MYVNADTAMIIEQKFVIKTIKRLIFDRCAHIFEFIDFDEVFNTNYKAFAFNYFHFWHMCTSFLNFICMNNSFVIDTRVLVV